MNKRELINEVAAAADVTKRDAEAVISSIISAITGPSRAAKASNSAA